MIFSVRKAVIPAAGLGTRLLPATKAQPKEMLPIIDIPIIQLVVQEATAAGIKDILIITGKHKRAIEDHFDYSHEIMNLLETKDKQMYKRIEKISKLANIHYVRQQKPKGLGDAVLYAKDHIGNEPFAVLLGDTVIKSEVPCMKQLVKIYGRFKKPLTGVEMVTKEEVTKFGIIEPKTFVKDIHIVRSMVEKPDRDKAPSNLAMNARYILTPEIFGYLERLEGAQDKEVQLTNAINEYCKKNTFLGCDNVGKRYDIGDRIGYLKAIIDHAIDREDIKKEIIPYLRKKLRA